MTTERKTYTVRHRLVIDYIYDAVEADSENEAVEKTNRMVKMPVHEWANFKNLKARSERTDMGWTVEEKDEA